MKVFVSYRRSDTQHIAGRIADRLDRTSGIRKVFFDVDQIEPGTNFEKSIEQEIQQSDVCLIIIGSNWVGNSEAEEIPRIHLDRDFVRLEVAKALSSGKRIIPVLIDGADMPGKEFLPEDVQPLTSIEAIFLRHKSFKQDMNLLEDAILMRKSRAPASRFFLHYPRITLLLRFSLGVLTAGLLLICFAIAHDIVTGGRALNQTFGSQALVQLLIVTWLVAGGFSGAWFMSRK